MAGVGQKMTAIYQPIGNGMVERPNQILFNMFGTLHDIRLLIEGPILFAYESIFLKNMCTFDHSPFLLYLLVSSINIISIEKKNNGKPDPPSNIDFFMGVLALCSLKYWLFADWEQHIMQKWCTNNEMSAIINYNNNYFRCAQSLNKENLNLKINRMPNLILKCLFVFLTCKKEKKECNNFSPFCCQISKASIARIDLKLKVLNAERDERVLSSCHRQSGLEA